MPKVIVLLATLLLSSTGGARSLQEASQQELLELRQTVEERLKYFNFLSVLDEGIPAGTLSQAQNSYQHYLKKNSETQPLLISMRTNSLCTKFADTFLLVSEKIKSDLSAFIKNKKDEKKRLLLEARLGILSQMRLQLVSLVESDQEGGAEALTGRTQVCTRRDNDAREQLKEKLSAETLELNSVYKNLFGVRGLIAANRLSVGLAHLAESQAASRLRWFLPKTIGVTVLAIASWELIVVKGLATLSAAGTLAPATTQAIATGLKAASIATTATLGSIQGGRLGAASVPLLSLNEEEFLLDDINSFIKLPLNSPDALFDRVYPVEGQLANELLEMKRQAKSDEAYILKKWGTLEGARSYHQKKLAEINDLLAK